MSEEEKKPQQHNSGQGSVQVTGDGNFILHLDPTLARLAESQMQAAFYQATGIYCAKEARIDLESLLENLGITVREIKRAWRSGAMTHNLKRREFEFHNRRQDLLAGGAGLTLASLLYLVFNLAVFVPENADRIKGTLFFIVSTLIFFWVLGFLFFVFIYPQNTAKKIREAIRSSPTVNLDQGEPSATKSQEHP